MFDTHCHLQQLFTNLNNSSLESVHPFADDLEYLCHTKEFFLCVTTDESEWESSLSLAKSYSHVLVALGLHPWFVDNKSIKTLDKLDTLTSSMKASAIGEIGLDFGPSYKKNQAIQIEAFVQQLGIAANYNLPTSLHIVKAHNEALQALKANPVNGVVHGLGTSVEMAERYVELGLKIGVNGVSVRDNAVRYHALIKHFGLQHIVLETDFPNVTLAGQVTAHLFDIQQVAAVIANLLNLSVEEVISETDKNAHQLFFSRNAL